MIKDETFDKPIRLNVSKDVWMKVFAERINPAWTISKTLESIFEELYLLREEKKKGFGSEPFAPNLSDNVKE